MRPNIAVIGFYNMEDLRRSQPSLQIPEAPISPAAATQNESKPETPARRRKRGDTSARLIEGSLPTDVIKNEEMMSVTDYMTIIEDLALRYRLNVAIGKGFESLETPRKDGTNIKKFIDLWPIQMSAAVTADGQSVLTTNFDTYTLILQLGYILRTVPAWKETYNLRVLVFVEYESEVEEERGRLGALLEKLRIDAQVVVFWLASGDLPTYETIIHGRYNNHETDNLVNQVLKTEEWWEDLQNYRGSHSMTGSQEFASITNVLESTSGRPGLYNPHSAADDVRVMRRHSLAQLTELPKKPTVSQLVKLGINMGIHTQNLPFNVFDSSDSDFGADSDSENDSDSSGTRVVSGAFNDGDSDMDEPVRRPLLATLRRRRSHGDVLAQSMSPKKERKPKVSTPTTPQTYGAISPVPRNNSDLGASQTKTGSNTGRGILKPERPSLTRQSSTAMRFSSNLVPQTTITNEDGAGPRIMFTEENTRSPAFSRKSSANPLNKLGEDADPLGEESANDKKVSFMEGVKSPARSRRGSGSTSTSKGQDNGGDASVNIDGLLASYQFSADDDTNTGSTYSTQGLPLSFNDLPSRAQHLILNELMRRQSKDTAVLFTTLPIPEENTCQNEESSLAYLSDVEVLCNELPPTLLVLSNNMTVTVSL